MPGLQEHAGILQHNQRRGSILAEIKVKPGVVTVKPRSRRLNIVAKSLGGEDAVNWPCYCRKGLVEKGSQPGDSPFSPEPKNRCRERDSGKQDMDKVRKDKVEPDFSSPRRDFRKNAERKRGLASPIYKVSKSTS